MDGAWFDQFEDSLMNVIEDQFGETCTWQPSKPAGAPLQTELVLFKDATKPQGFEKFPDIYPTIEFKRTQFTTLKALVDDTKNREKVTIRGKVFGVRAVRSKYDGDTMVATIDPDI